MTTRETVSTEIAGVQGLRVWRFGRRSADGLNVQIEIDRPPCTFTIDLRLEEARALGDALLQAAKENA